MSNSNSSISTMAVVIGTLVSLGACCALLALFNPSLFLASNQGGFVYQHAENDRTKLTLWWDTPPSGVKDGSLTSSESNIHPNDYAGPETCKRCHPKNHKEWSDHPHRWMNALANESSVKGDFSDGQQIEFMKGKATFYRKDGEYRMRLERNSLEVEFLITQTIGSRFTQYYAGRQIQGAIPASHLINSVDHVLPFGYWMSAKEWIPVVHVSEADEYPDAIHTDPFDFAKYPFPGYYACNMCHTTFPMADGLSRTADKLCQHVPMDMDWSVYSYLSDERPELLRGKTIAPDGVDLLGILSRLDQMAAPKHAVTMGISCEACHLGAKEHAEGKKTKPDFFPKSPNLMVDAEGAELDYGRNQRNVNWACARCHAGQRPQLAAGVSTWNSTEFSDGLRGACYSKLTCIHCHNPHKKIGTKWTRTPDEDDASCIACHEEFGSRAARRAHSHHAPGSAGDRCMNCHMPHLNEGLEDVVRTHVIFSPTHAEMIKANHPNACSVCHTDKTIGWTLKYLNQWYDAGLSDDLLAQSYPNPDQPAVLGYLRHGYQHVRLVAGGALVRDGGRWTIPHLIEALDDDFLLNRQFAYKGLQAMLDIDLSEEFGYRFYLMSEERAAPLKKIREWLASENLATESVASENLASENLATENLATENEQ